MTITSRKHGAPDTLTVTDLHGTRRKRRLKPWVLGTACLVVGMGNGALAQDQAERDQDETEVMVVTGRAAEFYKVDETTVGLRGSADILDIPQSVQVLTRQLIDDQAAQEITELYRNISGLSEFSYSGVTFRGFRQDEVRFDGLMGDPFAGFAVPRLFDIERIEVIKGATGAAYGGGEPGGLINYVTKAPSARQETSVAVRIGNFDLYAVDAEVTGALTDDGSIRARIGGSFETSEPFRFNTDFEDLILVGDIEADLGADTLLSVKIDYYDQTLQAARLRGVPVNDEGDFIADRGFNTNEETDFQSLESVAVTAKLFHDFSDRLNAVLAFRYVNGTETQNYHEPRGFLDGDVFIGNRIQSANADTRVAREFRDQLRENEQYSAFLDMTYTFDWGFTNHQLLVGAEAFRQTGQDLFMTAVGANRVPGEILAAGYRPVPSVALLDPDYGQSNPAVFDFIDQRDRSTDFTQYAFYVQDQIKLSDKWIVSLGGRYEAFTDELEDNRSNPFLGVDVSATRQEDDDAAFVFRGGLIHKPVENLSLYGVFSQGFQPQPASSAENTNGPFDPERSRLVEIGVKWDGLGGRLLVQSALYQINKTDLLVSDPNPNAPVGSVLPLGEVRSRGFEVDMVGDITQAWAFSLNYAYNETEIISGPSSGIPNLAAGQGFVNAPEHQISLWTRYDIPSINSAISGGVSYVSEQFSFAGQQVQPFAPVDIAWTTNWRFLTFQVNARNLFDEEYAVSGFLDRTGHFPGPPREVIGEITARF